MWVACCAARVATTEWASRRSVKSLGRAAITDYTDVRHRKYRNDNQSADCDQLSIPGPQGPRRTPQPNYGIVGSFSAVTIGIAMRRIRSACCAREASGHAVALPRPAMNSRRRILDPSRSWESLSAGTSAREPAWLPMLAKLLKIGFSASRPIFRKALMSAFGAEWKWTRRQSSLPQSEDDPPRT